jgi:hypothetical protein
MTASFLQDDHGALVLIISGVELTDNMSIHRSIASSLSSQAIGPITLAYQRRIISGNLQSDSAQLLLSSKLVELYTISPHYYGGSRVSVVSLL